MPKAQVAPPLYRWKAPQNHIEVFVRVGVIERLRPQIIEAFKSVPKRGLEIGGLLLGRSEPGRIFVEDYEIVPCEHRRGPSFTLSPQDREQLQIRLSKRRNLEVIGFFRSHTRPGLYLDEDDYSVVSTYFADPQNVVLLIRPEAHEPPAAGFFLWEDGEMDRRSAAAPFPFHERELMEGDYEILNRAEPPQREREVKTPAPAAAARASRKPLKLPKWWWAPAAAAALALAVWAGFRGLPHRRPAPVAADSSLALNVERSGNLLRLTWNRQAPAVRNADRGTLWIKDGKNHESLDLDRNQLTSGSVAYWPKTNDVDFRLEVAGAGVRAVESVRTIAPGSQTSRTVAASQAPPPPVAEPETVRPEPVAQPPAAVIAKAPRSLGSFSKIPSPPARAAVPETGSADRPAPEISEPPRLEASGPDLTRPAIVKPTMPAPPPPAAVPAVRVSVEPAAPHVIRRALNRIPGLRSLQRRRYKAGEDYEPPKPVHQVTPSLPPRLRQQLEGAVPVDLRVYVDSSGKVRRAEMLSEDVDPPLSELALNAARKWEFTPARIGEERVPAEVIVHFVFSSLK